MRANLINAQLVSPASSLGLQPRAYQSRIEHRIQNGDPSMGDCVCRLRWKHTDEIGRNDSWRSEWCNWSVVRWCEMRREAKLPLDARYHMYMKMEQGPYYAAVESGLEEGIECTIYCTKSLWKLSSRTTPTMSLQAMSVLGFLLIHSHQMNLLTSMVFQECR